jgi:microcystin-dependent protein
MRSLNTLSVTRLIALIIQAGEIESLNYVAGVGVPPYSSAGTRLDLINGNIYTPGLFVDGATGDVDVRGDITARSLTVLDALAVPRLIASDVVTPGGATAFGLAASSPTWTQPEDRAYGPAYRDTPANPGGKAAHRFDMVGVDDPGSALPLRVFQSASVDTDLGGSPNASAQWTANRRGRYAEIGLEVNSLAASVRIDAGTGPDDVIELGSTVMLEQQMIRPAGYWIGLGEIGDIVATVSTLLPLGWRWMNGTVLVNAVAALPEAWAALPAAWRSGSNINLPNWNGLFLQATTGTPGGTGGSSSVTIPLAAMPVHDHAITSHTHTDSHTHTIPNHQHILGQNGNMFVIDNSVAGGAPNGGGTNFFRALNGIATPSGGGGGATSARSVGNTGGISAATDTGNRGSGSALALPDPPYATVRYRVFVGR